MKRKEFFMYSCFIIISLAALSSSQESFTTSLASDYSNTDTDDKSDMNHYTQDDISNNPVIQINASDIKSEPGKRCNYQNCPLYQGVCVDDTCICSYDYTTFKYENEPLIYCNYKQKSKFTAFFLEFFFPVGAGHLYAGKTLLAVIKFSLFLIFFCGMCSELCSLGMQMNKLVICSAFVILVDMFIWIILQFIDIICYAFGIYKDGNGVAMI